MGTRGWFVDCAVTPTLGIASAALSWAGQGRTVFTGTIVVVVVDPARVVVVDPGTVEVVEMLEAVMVVVVVADPVAVAVATSSDGSASTTPTEITIRVVSRSDARVGTLIVHENIGTIWTST